MMPKATRTRTSCKLTIPERTALKSVLYNSLWTVLYAAPTQLPNKQRNVRRKYPEMGRGRVRQKGGSDPTFSPGLRPEKHYRVAPALSIFVVVVVLARVMKLPLAACFRVAAKPLS
jgi:hypothetical protein